MKERVTVEQLKQGIDIDVYTAKEIYLKEEILYAACCSCHNCVLAVTVYTEELKKTQLLIEALNRKLTNKELH